MHRQLSLSAALAIAPLVLASCGERPVRVDQSPPNETIFEGQVRLTGELAQKERGTLFVSARPVGSRMPILSRKFTLDDPAIIAAGGERVLEYELTREHFMGGTEFHLPPDVEIKITFDPDGIVETFDGVESVVVPATVGSPSPTALLHEGMPAPDEPPSSLATSQPTAPAEE